MLTRLALVLIIASWICAAATPAKCPAKRGDVKAGARCTAAEQVCAFPGGAWCSCEQARCVSAAGPTPRCDPTAHWVCRDDGCPQVPSGACTDGKQCGYDDGLCSLSAVCRKGKWKIGQQSCRPAAPHLQTAPSDP